MDNFARQQTNIPQCRKKTQRNAKQPKMDCLDDGKEAKLLKISELVFYRVRKSGSKMKESSKNIWNMFFFRPQIDGLKRYRGEVSVLKHDGCH